MLAISKLRLSKIFFSSLAKRLLNNWKSGRGDHELYCLNSKIDISPLQQFTLTWIIDFLHCTLSLLALPPAETHTRYHSLLHVFDEMCSNFEYQMVGSKAGRCILLKLNIVMVLNLEKNLRYSSVIVLPLVLTNSIVSLTVQKEALSPTSIVLICEIRL